MDVKMWNERYSQEAYVYGKAPNKFIAQKLKGLKAGKILFPCEGEGRNAVYAAKVGWIVDAFDFSNAGYDKAMKLADQEGVTLNNFWIADAEAFAPKPEEYDAIGLAYCHVAPEIRHAFHQNLLKGLKPGGMVLFEAFAEDQLSYDSGGPPVIERLFTKNQVEEEFAGLQFQMLQHEVVHLQEGRYHSGDGAVIRMVGIKPD